MGTYLLFRCAPYSRNPYGESLLQPYSCNPDGEPLLQL